MISALESALVNSSGALTKWAKWNYFY